MRELRGPEGRECPFCNSKKVIKRGSADKELVRQRYECKEWGKRFDDLTDIIFWNIISLLSCRYYVSILYI